MLRPEVDPVDPKLDVWENVWDVLLDNGPSDGGLICSMSPRGEGMAC